jgi:phage shock protein PspC (stress-responsive transcriptional regulator)
MYTQPMPGRQFRRNATNKVISGVCSGIAEYYGISIIFTRLVFFFLALANGIGLIIYLLLVMIIPAREASSASQHTDSPSIAPVTTKKSVFAYITGVFTSLGHFLLY